MRSPLGHVELSGQVECMRCGLRQAFDPAQWVHALVHAHDVVDLSSGNAGTLPPAIAQRSKHARIGIEYTSSTKTQATTIMDASGTRKHTLRTTVSPGHPLCVTCKVPLEIACEGAPGAPNATVKTRCPRCQEVASYTYPATANPTGANYPALRGAIAAEHRSDRPLAKMTRGQGGVEALACPQCGAALAAGAGELVKCAFCNLVAKVPGKLARHQRSGEPDPITPFWVLFEGTSRGRRKLLLGKSEDNEDDDDDVVVAAPAPGASPIYVHPGPHAAAAKASSTVKLIVGLSIAFALIVVVVALGVTFYLMTGSDNAPVQAPAAPAPPRRNK